MRAMTFTIYHTAIGARPHWRTIEKHVGLQTAQKRAYDYAMEHGGYVCVKNSIGRAVFGTEPNELDRAIASGANRHFTAPSY
jgi:hypothetical protein